MQLKFGTLWFGNKPTLLQYLSWNSYIRHGHELNIFLYDMSIQVPEGVIKRNANKILLENNIFLPKLHHKKDNNEHAEFSYADVFRIHMIKKTNLVWTDSDIVCLSDDWPNPDPYLFGIYSNFPMGYPEISGVNNDILYIKDHHLLDQILEELKYIPKNFNGNRGLTGPNLLSSILIENNLMQMAYKEDIFHPIRWNGTHYFLDEDKVDEVLQLTHNSLAVSLFHSSWSHHGLKIPDFKDDLKNNYIGHLIKKYLPNGI